MNIISTDGDESGAALSSTVSIQECIKVIQRGLSIIRLVLFGGGFHPKLYPPKDVREKNSSCANEDKGEYGALELQGAFSSLVTLICRCSQEFKLNGQHSQPASGIINAKNRQVHLSESQLKSMLARAKEVVLLVFLDARFGQRIPWEQKMYSLNAMENNVRSVMGYPSIPLDTLTQQLQTKSRVSGKAQENGTIIQQTTVSTSTVVDERFIVLPTFQDIGMEFIRVSTSS
uniref:Uncharacterized protein n=1 Tax=Heterosigma akashiwo TaxID=2829 RepID=A0A7S3XZU0_HETAK